MFGCRYMNREERHRFGALCGMNVALAVGLIWMTTDYYLTSGVNPPAPMDSPLFLVGLILVSMLVGARVGECIPGEEDANARNPLVFAPQPQNQMVAAPAYEA